ncbi:ASCH domain-containing protein, partial [Acinetobacter baumannii]
AAFPGEQARYYLPISIGGHAELADQGAALILSGVKTATSSPSWDYPDGRIPFVGALSVLLDGRGEPVAIVQTVSVEPVRFADVTDTMAWVY